MKTTYLVWEDSTCNGINPVWQELTGQEFYAFVRSAKASGRYFIKLDDFHDGNVTVIEATKASYLTWRMEKRRREYLEACAEGTHTVSYHALESGAGGYGEELLEDRTVDVLSECLTAMTRETLKAALASLEAEEYRLIAYLYLSDMKGTEREYARLAKTTKSTLNRRKSAILKKLKVFFEKDAGQI